MDQLPVGVRIHMYSHEAMIPEPTVWAVECLGPAAIVCHDVEDFGTTYFTNDEMYVTCQDCLEWLHA
jgi:hypothetical protein